MNLRRISILLTVIALMLWSYSITQSKLNIGFYGLIHSFPITFFIALGILTIASAILWVSKENHEKLLFLQVSLFIISLWLIPLLIGGSQLCALGVRQRFAESVTPLVQEGFLGGAWYHNWPATWLVATSLVDILGLNSFETLITLAPWLLQFLFLLPLYVFLKGTVGQGRNNYYWAGIWIFELALWTGQSYFGAQAFGFFLILSLLALLVPLASKQKIAISGHIGTGYKLSIILLFMGLTITHLLSSLVGLIMVALLYIVNRKKMNFNLVLIPAIFIVTWMIYQTTAFFEARLPEYIHHAFRLDLTLGTDILGMSSRPLGIKGSESHQAVAIIRVLTSAIFGIVCLIGIIIGRQSKKDISSDNAVLAIGVGALLGLIAGSYGGELTQRTWLFLSPVVSYFALKLFNHKAATIILFIVLLVGLPLHFISHYGNQAVDYLSPSHMAGSQYVDAIKDNSGHPFAKLSQLSWKDDNLVFDDDFPESDHYFTISRRDDARYDFLRNEPLFVERAWSWLNNSKDYARVYANPEVNLYINEKE